jgi:hypothetical protein
VPEHRPVAHPPVHLTNIRKLAPEIVSIATALRFLYKITTTGEKFELA